MPEFSELLVLADHACSTPSVQRIEAYEPVRMETLWLHVFSCCSQIYGEPAAHTQLAPVLRALPLQVEAA